MEKGKGEPRCWGRVRVNLDVLGNLGKGEPRCWRRVRVNLGVKGKGDPGVKGKGEPRCEPGAGEG